MDTLDWSSSRLTPFPHQIEDTATLIQHPFVFVASEMRTGKTKIVIDAAHFLYRQGVVNRVVIVAPAPVRDVWFDPDFGEIQKHCWKDVDNLVTEYHSILRQWTCGPSRKVFSHPGWQGLKWIITNYDFIRSDFRLRKLLPYINAKTLLVLDESSAVKQWKAKQTRACERLRFIHTKRVVRGQLRWIKSNTLRAGRIVLLNGTPFETVFDLFSQGNLLHPSILGCKYISHFKARYAVMGGATITDKKGKKIAVQIKEWTNLGELTDRFTPHTIRRLQKDVLKHLPAKLDPVIIPVTLDARTWSYYTQMRDDMVIALGQGDVAMAPQAITRVMRLAQITSGFVGGIESLLEEGDSLDDFPAWIREANPAVATGSVREIGREKLDALLWFYHSRHTAQENFKMVSWCRFRPEMERVFKEITEQYPDVIVRTIAGGQSKADRLEAIKLLHPETTPNSPIHVVGTFGTGSKGLNFTAAHTSVNCSSSYSTEQYKQSGDRLYGPGQTHPVGYYDLIAQGPKGQRTIDHIIVKARQQKEDVQEWTTSQWVRKLKGELDG